MTLSNAGILRCAGRVFVLSGKGWQCIEVCNITGWQCVKPIGAVRTRKVRGTQSSLWVGIYNRACSVGDIEMNQL